MRTIHQRYYLVEVGKLGVRADGRQPPGQFPMVPTKRSLSKTRAASERLPIEDLATFRTR